MPTHQGLGSHNVDRLQDRREPAIQLDQEQPIAAGELDTSPHLLPQYSQLMPECGELILPATALDNATGVLCLKPALRLERRGEQRQQEAQQRDHDRRR